MDPTTVLQNGITSILDAIHALIPAWHTTAQNLDSTAQAVAQLAAAANSNVEVSVAQTIIPLPEEYKGAKDKAAYFIRSCNQYFTRVGISKDEVKIATALALMKGDDASKWAENQLELIQDGHEDAYTNWKAFCTAFKDHFGDRTPEITAAAKIKRLFMGTDSAERYNTLFNNLKNDTKWNEAALIDRYKAGLDARLLMTLYHCDPMPITLKQWQDKADLLDKQERELRMRIGQGGSASRNAKSSTTSNFAPRVSTFGTTPTSTAPFTNNAAPTTSPKPTPPSTRDSNAMEVDATARRPRPKCFKCGQLGHIARNCPTNIVRVVDVNEMTEEEKRSLATELREQGF
ncbi:hypothetical protein LshimejAT787_0208470 [Lyophyllum shimeji]|uniref:CCHC-type domain-containing protein n=1 Tax=Lyophyllum shimeji TaxID=47721 RepID=A0A9P3PH38_LYOSH|nr:hypothetical protein LshimejAT787_0208470 [Lyophyllum shimeji]